jgi:hypothetical protein
MSVLHCSVDSVFGVPRGGFPSLSLVSGNCRGSPIHHWVGRASAQERRVQSFGSCTSAIILISAISEPCSVARCTASLTRGFELDAQKDIVSLADAWCVHALSLNGFRQAAVVSVAALLTTWRDAWK